MPSIAMADDPRDPSMRDPRNRARDRAIIRQLNRDELARVRQRDARYAAGWKAYRERGDSGQSYRAQRADHDRAMADYARRRADYERQRATWRHAVAACQAGRYEYCDR
ncbi:MAG: hypothetical protein KGM18_04375 [Sphingomonadales bacterium]|nr:hypothetical protein [Sphingomonadales bacterium]